MDADTLHQAMTTSEKITCLKEAIADVESALSSSVGRFSRFGPNDRGEVRLTSQGLAAVRALILSDLRAQLTEKEQALNAL